MSESVLDGAENEKEFLEKAQINSDVIVQNLDDELFPNVNGLTAKISKKKFEDNTAKYRSRHVNLFKYSTSRFK